MPRSKVIRRQVAMPTVEQGKVGRRAERPAESPTERQPAIAAPRRRSTSREIQAVRRFEEHHPQSMAPSCWDNCT